MFRKNRKERRDFRTKGSINKAKINLGSTGSNPSVGCVIVKKNQIIAEVIQGGMLSSNKGFNLPNTNISQPALTEKDIEDAIFSSKQNPEFLFFPKNR